MKKALCIFVAGMLLLLCSCTGDTAGDTSVATSTTTTSDPTSATTTSATASVTEGSTAPTHAADGMTLIRLSENGPPVCKTTSDREAVRRVRELIDNTLKEPFVGSMPGGWRFKVDFSDGSIFTVSHGLLGSNTGNYTITAEAADALYDALMAIYNATDAEESRYTANRYDS